jgi:P2 family phage contractile tail tube protein
MEYANLFAGSAPENDTASNHLVISEVKLPSMDVQYVDHRAGGAPVAIEIDTIMARLEATFVLVGITPQVMELLYAWEPHQDRFFVYGSLRDQVSGNAVQAAAFFRGQLGRVDPQNFRKGDLMHVNYSIRGITHYELKIGSEAVYYWDFFIFGVFPTFGKCVTDQATKGPE